jgi:hypothetical protein
MSWQLGKFLSLDDGLSLLPVYNDFCHSKACMSHRVCYTRFNQFVDHSDNIMRMVDENVVIIDAYVAQLKESYAYLLNLES